MQTFFEKHDFALPKATAVQTSAESHLAETSMMHNAQCTCHKHTHKHILVPYAYTL